MTWKSDLPPWCVRVFLLQKKKKQPTHLFRGAISPHRILHSLPRQTAKAWFKKTDLSPLEDVLGYVSRGWGVPLDGVRVGLVASFSNNHLDWTVSTCKSGQDMNIVISFSKFISRYKVCGFVRSNYTEAGLSIKCVLKQKEDLCQQLQIQVQNHCRTAKKFKGCRYALPPDLRIKLKRET